MKRKADSLPEQTLNREQGTFPKPSQPSLLHRNLSFWDTGFLKLTADQHCLEDRLFTEETESE